MNRYLLCWSQWPPARLLEQDLSSQVDIREFLTREGPVRAADTCLDYLADEQCVVASHVGGDQPAIERGQGVLQPKLLAMDKQPDDACRQLG